MCHARHFLWRQRNERFEEDVRRLFDHEQESPEPSVSNVEHEPDEGPAADSHPPVVLVHG